MVMDIDECNNSNRKCSNLINMSTCFIQIIKCLYNNAPPLNAFTTISHYALKEVRHFFQTHFLYVFKEQLL